MNEIPLLPLDNTQVNLYEQASINNVYDFDPGVCILPLAEDPPIDPNELKTWSPVVTLRLHAPYRVRKVNYVNVKQNNPPVMPTPDDVGSFIFIGGSINVTNVPTSQGLTYDWGIVSNYTYVENCVSRPDDGLVLGSQPFTWNVTEVNVNYTGIANRATLLGAIANAGYDVLTGVAQGDFAEVWYQADVPWGYNTPSYYPGFLFEPNLINGGTPPPIN